MIYCSCGGQKNCFRCDGKGWIDEPVADDSTADAGKTKMPPILKEYSQRSESGSAKVDWGRIKPLIARVNTAGSIPRSSSNMEAARAKKRKKTKVVAKPAASEQLPTRQRKERQKPRGVGKLHGDEIGKFLTEEQLNQLAKHEREVAKLIEVLPSAGDAADAVQKRILDENRAIRKLRIKARRAKRKQQELNLSP